MEAVISFDPRAYRNKLCRICFIFIFASLLYSLVSHTMVSQLMKPVIKFPSTDMTYWIFHLLRIPELISGNNVLAICMDILLFGTCLMVILYPGKTQWTKIFFTLYFVYFVIYNTYGMHHVHSKVAILLMTVPFLIRDPEGFLLLWQGLRYYVCFIYTSAFCWKFIRGSWNYEPQAILIIKKNLTAYLYFNSQTTLANIYAFLIQHPFVTDVLAKAGFLMEGFFVVGFFTRRFDKLLLIFSILLPLGFLLMADAFFYEFLFLAIVFYKSRTGEFLKVSFSGKTS